MNHVFGPVSSRRLGRSLGIDPVPSKTCNFNCVYCQLGRTHPFTTRRHAFFAATELFAEIATAIAEHEPGEIDWITFVGSGETTLFSRLGCLIDMVRSITDLPIAVITNGSLLGAAKMRRELASADAVLPSLDAGNEVLFRRINRPHPSLRFDDFVEGLERFRGGFAGRLWVEVMLVQGLNDGDRALTEIAAIVDRIRPDGVHLSVPTRPPAEPWVAPPDEAALQRAAEILGGSTKVLRPVDVEASPEAHDDLIATVQAVVSRHPLREAELVALLERWRPGRAAIALARLRDSGRFQIVDRFGESFWCSREGIYSPGAAARAAGRGADQAC